jgi:predicted dehydrogenase
MSRKIQWGIIGLGKIAHKFALDLLLSDDAELYGVASRDKEKAEEFRRKYSAKKSFGSYEELVQDQEIDVVYIATPHPFHFENTMLCLDHNKGVLCEKPMGMNLAQTMAVTAKAQSKGLFLMEGLWTWFISATEKLIELLERKVIGDVLFIRADFGFKADLNPDGRIYNKSLGGGSLLDVGIYPVYMSLLVLGIPTQIQSMARFTASGVDSYCSIMFDYGNDAKASLESTAEADTPIEAHIYGENGSIKLHSRFQPWLES